MKITVHESLPEEAMVIRQRVFVEEQGFIDEFDEQDKHSVHLLAWDEDQPVGTCRIFAEEGSGEWHLGRLAVVRDMRKKHVGALLMKEAEEQARERGAVRMILGAQYQAVPFYEKQGWHVYGEQFLDQNYPHYPMEKTF